MTVKKNKDNKNKKLERLTCISMIEAIDNVKANASKSARKFTESVEIAVMLGIDSKQSSQNIKSSIVLPNGTGKQVKVVVITPDESLQQASKKAGAILVGFEDLISKIEDGFTEFDNCIATPDAMQKLSKAAKKLGPRGLMPSPKNGTVTTDVVKAVQDCLKGKVNFKNEKNGIVHCMIGKVNFSSDDLAANAKSVIKAIRDAKPEGVKGKYIKKCYFSTTMGSSVELLESGYNA